MCAGGVTMNLQFVQIKVVFGMLFSFTVVVVVWFLGGWARLPAIVIIIIISQLHRCSVANYLLFIIMTVCFSRQMTNTQKEQQTVSLSPSL